jgi:glycosyltransferase involved in cell wall biosynthesis
MKILMVTPMPPQRQPTNAVPLVLHAQLTGLVSRHEMTLVTVAGPDPAEWHALEQLRASGVDVQAIWRTEPYGIRRWGRRWRLASAWLRGKYPWRTIWFWEPGVQQILDRLLAEQRFDLIHIDDNAVGIYRCRTNTPTIFTEHEVRRPRPIDWHFGSKPNWIRWALSEADWHRWRRYQPAVWRRFDRIQVFTPRDAAAIRAIVPELAGRVRVNPFGIEIPAAADPSREENGAVAFAGGFSHQPNVDAALWLGNEIIPLLRARCPGIRLFLVGSYPPEPVQALACTDIIVTGRVPEIEPFLERAAVILAPLRIGGGMRMKVLQGMALGKAVVTTPLGAEGLAIAGCQPPLVVAEDAKEIASAAAALLASPEARRSLGRRARTFVAEHYSPLAYARRLEAIYAELQPGEVEIC